MDYPGEMKIKMDHAAFQRDQDARRGCSNASCYCTGACKQSADQDKQKVIDSYWSQMRYHVIS